MQSVQAYLDRKALGQQLLVMPITLNPTNPTKSMNIYENFFLSVNQPKQREPTTQLNQDTGRNKDQDGPLSADMVQLEDVLQRELTSQETGTSLENLILRHLRAHKITDPNQVHAFLTDEVIEDLLNEQAHALLNKFNSHIAEITQIATVNMASVNKLYDNKVELLSTAFEADFARLSSLFAGLNKRLENLKAVSGTLTKDSFTLFLQRYKQQDDIPSIIEEKMLIMARCVQDRMAALRFSFDEMHATMKQCTNVANASIGSHLDLFCSKCNKQFDPSRRILIFAPCGHSLCEVCFYEASGQIYTNHMIVLANRRVACFSCNSLIQYAVLDRMINSRTSGRELDPRNTYAEIMQTLKRVQQILLKVDILSPDALFPGREDDQES